MDTVLLMILRNRFMVMTVNDIQVGIGTHGGFYLLLGVAWHIWHFEAFRRAFCFGYIMGEHDIY